MQRAESVPEPHSPRESVSPPPPDGALGEIEEEMKALHQSIYELGCSVLDTHVTKAGQVARERAATQVSAKVDQLVHHLSEIERIAQHIDSLVPIQVLDDIDNSRNPTIVTKDRIERAATENQFTNGKLEAIETYATMLDAGLREHFPEMEAGSEEVCRLPL